MSIGAFIDKGPADWQIMQQIGGKADIQLSGRWIAKKGMQNPRVYAKVFDEFNGEGITYWQACDMLSDGAWQHVLKDIPIGGPYRIETCLYDNAQKDTGGEWSGIEWALRGDMIFHVCIGDLFVIAGQSNAAGYGKDPVYDPPEIGVHILKNNGRWDVAVHPLNDSTGIIHENMEMANTGHSPFIQFAKMLKKELGHPVGLIQASLGSTLLSMWNPAEDGYLYRNMMKIIGLAGNHIKAVLWYQGGSDANRGTGDDYLQRFGNMVGCLRKDLDNDKLPVFTFQEGRMIKPGKAMDDCGYGKVREAQRQAAKTLDHVYIVSVMDCTLSDYVHHTSVSNMMLGERLAKMVLTELYGKKYICRAPDISGARKTGDRQITLGFGNVVGRLYSFDAHVEYLPFEVKDDHGVCGIISYSLKGCNEIILELDRVPEGKTVVHGGAGRIISQHIPIDWESHIPMLAFYNVVVE